MQEKTCMQERAWRVFVADAFTEQIFSGNQAGVVLLEEWQEFPKSDVMCNIAGELKHSETAFVKRRGSDVFHIRYFTPLSEVALCGHATIGAFQVLYEEGIVRPGVYKLYTKAQELQVAVEEDIIWMDMAAPREAGAFTKEQAGELYQAFGLQPGDMPMDMVPKIVNTGLSDILLPVPDSRSLQAAVQDQEAVRELSKRYDVVGVHIFSLEEDPVITARCRNFAPLYGIFEEAATGTSNGALTYYLYGYGYVRAGKINTFLQGEAMNRPSYIKSRLTKEADTGNVSVQIGGRGVISLKGEMICDEEGTQ